VHHFDAVADLTGDFVDGHAIFYQSDRESALEATTSRHGWHVTQRGDLWVTFPLPAGRLTSSGSNLGQPVVKRLN
jgi:hypothetical protein